ncbi:MAG TPA: DUF3224 domain-containing protein [Candidatus Acidoferrum sp.]|nr:DUF3224 domain-containing protein [Candidatus Acidoferrum sp.]
MENQSLAGASIVTCILLSIGVGGLARPYTRSQTPGANQKGASVTTHALGTFEVKVTPLKLDDSGADAALGRMSLDKQFHGDLEGTSRGEMLTAGTSVKGSAAYVAIERVTGTLNSHSGSFVLQHSGTMARGALHLTVTVVPDSGTGQLTGLSGSMTIKIDNGKHSYDFQYTLAENQ